MFTSYVFERTDFKKNDLYIQGVVLYLNRERMNMDDDDEKQ